MKQTNISKNIKKMCVIKKSATDLKASACQLF